MDGAEAPARPKKTRRPRVLKRTPVRARAPRLNPCLARQHEIIIHEENPALGKKKARRPAPSAAAPPPSDTPLSPAFEYPKLVRRSAHRVGRVLT